MKADLQPGARVARKAQAPRSLHVMLIEDDEDHVFLIRRALRDLTEVSIKLDVAGSGEQALDLLGRASLGAAPLPGLVLLDLRMPGMDGLTLCRHLKSLQPRMVTLIITAYGANGLRDEAREAGAQHILPKPIDFPMLLSLVEQAVLLSN